MQSNQEVSPTYSLKRSDHQSQSFANNMAAQGKRILSRVGSTISETLGVSTDPTNIIDNNNNSVIGYNNPNPMSSSFVDGTAGRNTHGLDRVPIEERNNMSQSPSITSSKLNKTSGGSTKQRTKVKPHGRSQSQSKMSSTSSQHSIDRYGTVRHSEMGGFSSQPRGGFESDAPPITTTRSQFADNIRGFFSGSLSNLTNAAQSFVSSGGTEEAGGYSNYYGRRPSGDSTFSNTHLQTMNAMGRKSLTGSTTNMAVDKYKTLLIIDERHTDWSKYFKDQWLEGEWKLRIEQAEFQDINVASYSDTGTVVDIHYMKGSHRVIKSFQPDFVLIRQHVMDVKHDWKNILLGFMYGNVPSLNSLESVYGFLDKPKIFSELLKIQLVLDKEQFPIIEQAYYPNYKEMMITPKFPIVIKIGNFHNGCGKIKVDNHYDFLDLTSLIAMTGNYCTIEPYIDSKYDLHIQKIGTSNYKAYMRKSISGNWKANMGSSILEEIPVNEKYKLWVDECSRLCGGLDILAVEAIKARDGKEYIIGVNDSSFNLIGESQEEDRRLIAQLTLEKMEDLCLRDKKSKGAKHSISKSDVPVSGYEHSNNMIPSSKYLLSSRQNSISDISTSQGSNVEQQPSFRYPGQKGGPKLIPTESSSKNMAIRDLVDESGVIMARKTQESNYKGSTTQASERRQQEEQELRKQQAYKEALLTGELMPPSMPPPPPIPPHPSSGTATPASRYPGQNPAKHLASSGMSHSSSGESGKSAKGPERFYAQTYESAGGAFMPPSSTIKRDASQSSMKKLCDDTNRASHVSNLSNQNLTSISPNSQNSAFISRNYSSQTNGNKGSERIMSDSESLREKIDKEIVGDTMGNLRKTFAGIFGDL